MAALTTANLVTRCETRFRDPNHEVITANEWVDYLNDGYQEVNGMFKEWPWQLAHLNVSVTAGDNSYVLDADGDILSVMAVYNTTDDYSLTPLEGTSQYRYAYPEDDETQTVVSYRWDGVNLELWPVPNSNITLVVDVVQSTADLVSGSVNPKWPNRYRRALVEYALSRAYLDDGNMEWSNEHRKIGDAIIAQMVHDLLSGTRTETFPRIVDDWY